MGAITPVFLTQLLPKQLSKPFSILKRKRSQWDLYFLGDVCEAKPNRFHEVIIHLLP